MKTELPVVYVAPDRIRFNVTASAYICKHNYYRIVETENYIVFSPCEDFDSGKYTITRDGDSEKYKSIGTTKFKNRIISKHHFKLYKYKDGFAIKKNRPLQIIECA